MRLNELAKEIDKLRLSEKLLLVEEIWDSIAKQNDSLPMPAWQKVELEKRYSEYKESALELHNWLWRLLVDRQLGA